MKVKLQRFALCIVAILSAVMILSCGGGTGDAKTESKTAEKKTALAYGMGETVPEVQAQIDALEIEINVKVLADGFPTDDVDGISWHMAKFERGSDGGALIWVRFDNNSSITYWDLHCAIQAYKNGEKVATADVNFGPMVVDPGESAMHRSHFFPGDPDGFANFDKLTLNYCTLNRGERSWTDIVDGPVKVEFVGYGESRPTLELSLTNSSTAKVTGATCLYDAKIGHVIVDTALMIFRGSEKGADQNDIAAGQTVVKKGSFSSSQSVDDFDSTFDYKNLNCSYVDKND